MDNHSKDYSAKKVFFSVKTSGSLLQIITFSNAYIWGNYLWCTFGTQSSNDELEGFTSAETKLSWNSLHIYGISFFASGINDDYFMISIFWGDAIF